MKDTIENMIKIYMKEKDFFGPATIEQITNAENTLGFKFPNEYKEYIQRFGSGGICGVDLEGIEGDLGASVVKATKKYRNLGLDNDHVVIWDMGEYINCMYTIDGDPCVYTWDPSDPTFDKRHESFTEFVVDVFQEAIDNY